MLHIDLDITKTDLQQYRNEFGAKAAAEYARFVGLPLGLARAWILEK